MSGYIGNILVPQATQTRDSFIATAGQTSFPTSGYTPNFLDVYLNGIKLHSSDFTATNGSDVVLTTGAAVNDVIDVVAYNAFDVASGTFDDLTVNNNIAVSGTVDGRDIAADGTKLDGIESGATGDQTNAEIRAAVEAATDSNVFTDADHTKLNAIEASATADQTAAEIRTLVESATDSNVFTDADHTKLNAIEANATADQTKSDIDALNINADTLDGQHGSYYTGYADTAVANIVDSAPGTLDTLNELAAALGDDPNFATTVTNSIATKLPLAGGTLTGNLNVTGTVTSDGLTVDANTATFSAGTSGNMEVVIQADTDNNDEGDSPSLVFKQDGGNTIGRIGLIGNSNDVFTGSLANALYIGNNEAANLQIYTDLKQRVRISNIGDISFYEDTGTTAKFFWDSSTERLGLGTSSPSQSLHVQGGSLLIDNGSSAGTIYLHDTTNYINLSSDAMQFANNGSERMRIDSNGNLLVGTTSTGAATASNGAYITPAGQIIGRSDGIVSYLNRRSTDGQILQFMKDGTQVGSIGVNSEYLYIHGTRSTDAGLMLGSQVIAPASSSGANRNNAIDLGFSGNSFKDLHLSGLAYTNKVVTQTIFREGADGSGLHFTTNAIYPTDQTSAISNGTESLGASSYRFKDLYLSEGLRADTLKFRTLAGTERMRINSLGNVGIGTSSPLADLHVEGNAVIGNIAGYETTHPGESGATLHVHNTATDGADTDGAVNFGDETQVIISTGAIDGGPQGYQGSLWFGTSDHPAGGGTLNAGGQWNWKVAGIASKTDQDTGSQSSAYGNLEFYTKGTNGSTSATLAMTIDESQNVLVGKSVDNFGTVGTAISQLGEIQTTRASATPMYIRRNTNDGELIGFYKDGTTVGSISSNWTSSTDFTISSNTPRLILKDNGGAALAFDGAHFHPWADNAIDLGYSANRWKDVRAVRYYGDGSNLTGVGGSTAYNGVGTYVYGIHDASGNTLTHNTTFAGSTVTALAAFTGATATSSLGRATITSGALSGTWRSMGGGHDTRASHHRIATLFVRIS